LAAGFQLEAQESVGVWGARQHRSAGRKQRIDALFANPDRAALEASVLDCSGRKTVITNSLREQAQASAVEWVGLGQSHANLMKTTLRKPQTGALVLGFLLAIGQHTHATIVDWQNQVMNVGATTAATNFTTVSGTAPILIDVGALLDDRSFEFIVNAGLAGMSGAFLGHRQLNGAQGLKFDQWQDSGLLGITDFGLVDHLSDDAAPENIDTHVAFVSDGLTGTDLYLNGTNVHTFAGVLLVMSGEQGLAGIAESVGGFSDLLDGSIFGFASYDVALTPAEVAAHSNAFFIPEPSAAALLGVAALSCCSRRRRRP
jgi:hypothetical protein